MQFKNYKVNHQHRGLIPINQKSQWRVTEIEEELLFIKAKDNGWFCPKSCLWSLDNNFSPIGEDHIGELFVAKFLGNQGEWHGYPISMKRQADRPPSTAIKDWVKHNIIRKRVGIKMAQGQF